MNKKKVFIIVTLSLILIAIGTLKYKTDYARKEINTYYSDDKTYKLVIYTIGEPEWPFGSGKCRFVLSKDGKDITNFNFKQSNDGKWATADDFNVSWFDDKVKIIVSGEEQEDITYSLFFNGTVTASDN